MDQPRRAEVGGRAVHLRARPGGPPRRYLHGRGPELLPEARTDIQEASKDLLRDAQWTDGTIAGIRRGAELINQPWYRSAAFLIPLWIGTGLAAAGAAAWLLVRWRTRVGCRRETAKGDAAYARVSMDLPVTELNAGTIPASSRDGGTVLEKHRSFLSRYDAATALSNRVHALTHRQQGGVRPGAGPAVRGRRRGTGRPG